MIRVRFLKRKKRGMKVDPKLGGPWEVKGKHLFAFSHFPPQQILLKPSI
jgi:hypothetical protein